MSMIGNLVAVSPEQLQSFMADPGLIVPFLSPDEGGAEPANHLDLDKAWHAIHFTLNGKEWEGEEPFFSPFWAVSRLAKMWDAARCATSRQRRWLCCPKPCRA